MYNAFKPGTKHVENNAECADTPDVFTDCGYILQPDEAIIDIDSIPKETIKFMIAEFGIDTETVWTDRGAHLYFRKPKSKVNNGPCALGFPIETKTRSSSPNGVTVKRNGVLRTIENPGKRQEMPWFFSSLKRYANLVGMHEGEGRNSALFSHRGSLDSHQDTEKILRFINEHLFADPLSGEEFQNVCRPYDRDNRGKKKEYDLATEIMNMYRCVLYQGTIWFWDGKRYVCDPEDQCRLKKLVYDCCPGKTTRYVDEVVRQIFYRGEIQSMRAYPIRFRNGVLMKGMFVPVTDYTEFTPYYIDIDYKEDAAPVKKIDDYIDNLTGGDADYRALLLEAMAFGLETDPEKIRSLGQFFILRGDGANGKGTFLQIMKRIYGEENCTALSIKELEDPRYQVTMIGKLLNLGDDVHPEAINNNQMKILKNISTADTVSARLLYHQSFSTTYTTKLFFTTNSDLRTFEKGYAYQRRVQWMPMFNRVEKPDPAFISRMTEETALKYWIRLMVEAYKRLYTAEKWTRCAVVDEYNRFYHRQNNYMAVFLETLDVETDVVGKTGPEIRRLYEEYNDDVSKPYNPRLLNDVLKEQQIGVGSKKINGRTAKVYMHQEHTQQKIA